MSHQNNKLLILAAQIGFLAFMGCELSEVRDGSYCYQNVEGYFANDSFHEVYSTTLDEIKELQYCTLDYPYCLDSVETIQKIPNNKKYCSRCDVDMVYASTNESTNEGKCITCAELKTCETESCKTAKETACLNRCEGNILYDYSHEKIRECDYKCEQIPGRAGTCVCPTGQIMNADDKCVCDTDNHWTGEQGNCTCEDGYHADGDQCVEDSDNCGIGKIPNAEHKCVCDADNGWTKASEESDECICADTHLLISGSCVKKLECGKGEILNENNNTCICDNASYWVGIAGSCACLDGYEETDGICQAPINCTTGEFYNEETKKCECDTLNGWTGDSGKCSCKSGYLLINGQCEQEKTCSTGAVLNKTTNTCACDTANNWTGSDPEKCSCKSGYLPISGKCEEQKTCSTGAVLNKTTNTCACDTANNWTGSDPAKCSCKSGYLPISGKCEVQKTCSTGAVLNKSTNTCSCDTKNHWTGSDPAKCSCAFGYKKDASTCRTYNPGETFSFGNYYINNDKTKEPIKWLVLEHSEKNKDYYIISNSILHVMKYANSNGVTWKDSPVLSWLNNTFYNEAFNDSEKARINVTTYPTDNNPNDLTQSKLFLLNLDESKAYFHSDTERLAKLTAKAITEVISTDYIYSDNYFYWWLRSKGVDGQETLINNLGGVGAEGIDMKEDGGVRPVMWLSYK